VRCNILCHWKGEGEGNGDGQPPGMTLERITPEGRGKAIVIAANTAWNLVNFRGNIIAALQQRGYRLVAIAPRDAHHAQLASMGVEFHALDFRSAGISPLEDARLFLRYFGLLRAIRPAAFLGFTIKPNVYGSLAARVLGIPVINNVSGLGTAFIKQGPITRIATFLYRLAFRRSATVFFQNREDRDQFVASGMVAAGQTRLLPGSGVDLDRFGPAAAPPTGEPFRFLLIARLLWDKGVQEFVDAARIVRQHHPGARFQILGFADVDNRTAVPRATLDGWIDEGLIEHLGAADDVRPFIAASDCVVLPSYREGLPRSLLEASAMARPIIGTDVPGVRDVVDDRVTGLLCAVRSATSLADAMLAMIALGPAERRAMGQAGRERVERRFAIEEVTRRYLEAVADALTHPDRPPGVKGSMNLLARIFGGSTDRPAPRGADGYRAYAVGDVHGRLDLLDRLLARIEADIAARGPAQNMVVFLGDLIDRGPQSAGVIERLRTWQPSDATAIFLCGNHEEIFLRVLGGEPAVLADWMRFGGAECLASYGLSPEALGEMSEAEALAEIKAAVPPQHQEFLATFADTFRFGDYLFVHAGIRPGLDVAAQSKKDLRWIREQFLDDPTDHGYVVVHGHTISAGVEERANRIGIDTGAYRTGRLTAVAIEGAQRWYLDTTPGD